MTWSYENSGLGIQGSIYLLIRLAYRGNRKLGFAQTSPKPTHPTHHGNVANPDLGAPKGLFRARWARSTMV